MFRHALKILRALLGAIALMLIVGGGFFVGAEAATNEGGEPTWRARKSAKPAIVSSARVSAACPMAVAAKAAAGRVSAAAPVEMIFAWVAKTRSGASAHGVRREPEREPNGRARQGVVRLLI